MSNHRFVAIMIYLRQHSKDQRFIWLIVLEGENPNSIAMAMARAHGR
jgi:hypothetical protein